MISRQRISVLLKLKKKKLMILVITKVKFLNLTDHFVLCDRALRL